MVIERINPPDVYQPFAHLYTQVVRATGTTQVHVAGTTCLRPETGLIGDNDMAAQTLETLSKIGHSLAAAGATPADVVRITVYATDVDRYINEGLPEVVRFFGATLPASTLVGVTRLADPRYLVEIEVTAILA